MRPADQISELWSNGVVAFFNTHEGKTELTAKFTADADFQINILKLSAMNATQRLNTPQRLTILLDHLNSAEGKEELRSMYDQDTDFVYAIYSLSCFDPVVVPFRRQKHKLR